jgi:omega-amidase
VKVYCCQLDIAWEDKERNFARTRDLLAVTKPEPGSLIVLPEMFATGFSMNVAGIHEPAGDKTEQFLQTLASEHNSCVIGGIVTRDRQGQGRNEALVFSPEGKMLARYAKIHPFSLGGESGSYSRGFEIVTFDFGGFKIAPFVCYDLRFPEIFRAAVQQGAEMFVLIANWPTRREQHWVTLLQARAIENLAWTVGVNRSGKDPQHVYPGRSMIVDPHGFIRADAGMGEGIAIAEADLPTVRSWREQFPALRDMHWHAQS